MAGQTRDTGRRIIGSLCLGMMIGMLSVSCNRIGGAENRISGLPSTAERPVNVLFVTLSSTRADRIGAYGYELARTPTLDQLAGTGVRFANALCASPMTLPSHASMLTGTPPGVNGLTMNGMGTLTEGIGTLAERFKQHGFRTGAFVSSWVLDSGYGLDRGFDHYGDALTGGVNVSVLPAEQPANRTSDAAIGWLAKQPDKPFFAWVQYFDPHAPYAPPYPYDVQLADPYDGEITFVDAQLRRLVNWLEQQGLGDNTLIIVAGDHGESFSEHGVRQHGYFVYNTTLQVPLILHYPAGLPVGAVIESSVGLIDLYPTLMDLMGWNVPTSVEGTSLTASWMTSDFQRAAVYSESDYPHQAFGWASLRALTTDNWKYIEAPQPELFDRLADPGERHNLIDQQPAVAAALREQLADRHVPSGTALNDPKAMLSEFQVYQQATALLNGSDFEAAAAMLKPMAHRNPESPAVAIALGQIYLGLKQPHEAELAYEAALMHSPDNSLRRYGLCEALRWQGKLPQAIACLERTLAAMPDLSVAHYSLGTIYSAMGFTDKAFAHLSRHVELNPDSVNAHLNLAQILATRQNFSEAAVELHAVLQIDPFNDIAHDLLWRYWEVAGHRDQAIDALRASVDEDAGQRDRLCTLAWMLSATEEPDPISQAEALGLAIRCTDIDPGNPFGHAVLGQAHAAMGDSLNASKAARQALELSNVRQNQQLSEMAVERLTEYHSDL